MANKQIHELAQAGTLAAADQFLVSTASGSLTRRASLASLPFAGPRAGAVPRTIAAKLADTASVRDFGAVGDGIADDTPAIAAALASGARSVSLPEGTYLTTAPLAVPNKTAVVGAGRDATVLKVAHNGYGLSWSGSEYVDGAVDGLRVDLPATSTAAAIRCRGNNFRASDLRVAGGGASAWGIELDQCNDFSISDVLMWGDAADAFRANGIWLRNSTSAAINYGDGTLAQISIRLGSNNTKALFFEGPDNGNVINNVMLAKATIHATGTTGSRGIHIRNSRRLTFVSVDLETMAEGVLEEGTAGDRTEMNQYVGVFALNVTAPYADSNGTVSRSVFNRLFVGCDNFPALSGFADGDSMIQRGLWLASWSNGQPLARLLEQSGYCRIDKGGAAHVLIGANASGNNSRLSCNADGASANSVTLYLGDSNLQRVSFEAPLHMGDRTGAPGGATDNMLVFANGSGWNPGFEKGLYGRATSWYRFVDTRMRGWVLVNEQTGTSYTLQSGDLGDRVEMVGTAAKTVTVPQMATVPGTSSTKTPGATDIVTGRKVQVEATVVQVGSGAIALAAASGVTITGPTATTADGQSLVLRWTSAVAVRSRLVA